MIFTTVEAKANGLTLLIVGAGSPEQLFNLDKNSYGTHYENL